MKKLIVVAILFVCLITITACGNSNYNKTIADNAEKIYLSILDESVIKEIDIKDITITVGIDETQNDKQYKLIFCNDSDMEKINDLQTEKIKGLMSNNNYWVLFHSYNFDNVKLFASHFGKSIEASSSSQIMGVLLRFNSINITGIPIYITTSKKDEKIERNDLIKSSLYDMINKRFDNQ